MLNLIILRTRTVSGRQSYVLDLDLFMTIKDEQVPTAALLVLRGCSMPVEL